MKYGDGGASGLGVSARRQVQVTEPIRAAVPSHLMFVGLEIVLLVLLGVLAVVVRGHPGPLLSDVGLAVDAQHALLHRGLLTAGLESISTLNWPIPTVMTLALVISIFLLLRRWLDAIVVLIAAGAEASSTYALSTWDHRPRPWGHGVQSLQHITSTYSDPT